MMETKQVTVEEMNRVIADFMDYLQLNQKTESPYLYAMRHAYDNGHLKYHSDWNWLMAVVDKINSLDGWAAINIDSGMVYVHKKKEPLVSYNRLEFPKTIDSVYKAVYDFIIWYNQQNH